jgi:hypothetical protein
MKYILFPVFSLFVFAIPPLYSQHELHGKILEITDGKAMGAPGIQVGVLGYDDDVTDASGSFILHLPDEWKTATLTLKNSALRIIRPAAGEVLLPAPQGVELQVCGAEKKRLLQKVEALEAEMKKQRRERTLSQQKIARLHERMLDTILYYEQVLQAKEAAIAQAKEDDDAQNQQVGALEQQLAALEKNVADLEQQLQIALAEKFRRQKKQFDAIAAALNNYVDQAKNLRDMLLPNRVSAYFLNPAAVDQYNAVAHKYNAARNAVLEGHEGWVVGVAHDWEDESLPDGLEVTCQFLLEEVHKLGVYPMEFAFIEPLKQYSGKQMTRLRAEKIAKEGVETAMPVLEAYIPKLEEKVKKILADLQERF